ncbi:sensor histidine kinase [Nocardia sp. BMG111209]|uniref:sensor histidine kinase n=1 Tax=Nocardia sp. BMG111209 TaxID=1160137 RepID=UPI001E464CF1|nr:histidine kinase [Nocardia sp. BMG111209]
MDVSAAWSRRPEPAGVARGIEWLFHERSLPVRLPALLLLATGCLLWLGNSPTIVDWALGLLAVAATVGGARRPLTTSLLTTGLLVLGFELGHTGPLVGKAAAAVALTELALRRGGWRPWLGAGALAAAYLLHPAGGAAAIGYRAVVMAGLPLVIGALLRNALDSAARAHRIADEIAARRRAEVAAARTAERSAIARELHDLIAHHVSSTVLRVGVARHALPQAPAAVLEVLDDIHSSGRETLADLRKLVAVLRDPRQTDTTLITAAELPEAIEAVVRRTCRLGPVVTTEIGDVATVDPVTAHTLLRLTQEGLANVVRHAGLGATARLTVTVGDGIDFSLSDNGSGAEPAPAGPGPAGLGLIGLAERVELLGGSMTAGPVATGWRLHACLPGRAR